MDVDRLRESVKNLEPTSIMIAVGVVIENHTLDQIDLHPLDDPDGGAVCLHRH